MVIGFNAITSRLHSLNGKNFTGLVEQNLPPIKIIRKIIILNLIDEIIPMQSNVYNIYLM
jgi:hypothetical protein